MRNTLRYALAVLAFFPTLEFSSSLRAEPVEKRIALVIGNANYGTKRVQTGANDAGLIAQTY